MLVCKDEDYGILHLAIFNDFVQLPSCFIDSLLVSTVHNENQAVRPLVVVFPQGANLVLTSNILVSKQVRQKIAKKQSSQHTYPDVEFDILVLYCFDVKSNSGNGCHALAQFQLIQNGYLPVSSKKSATCCSVLVFPAESRPTISMRTCLSPKSFLKMFPIEHGWYQWHQNTKKDAFELKSSIYTENQSKYHHFDSVPFNVNLEVHTKSFYSDSNFALVGKLFKSDKSDGTKTCCIGFEAWTKAASDGGRSFSRHIASKIRPSSTFVALQRA